MLFLAIFAPIAGIDRKNVTNKLMGSCTPPSQPSRDQRRYRTGQKII